MILYHLLNGLSLVLFCTFSLEKVKTSEVLPEESALNDQKVRKIPRYASLHECINLYFRPTQVGSSMNHLDTDFQAFQSCVEKIQDLELKSKVLGSVSPSNLDSITKLFEACRSTDKGPSDVETIIKSEDFLEELFLDFFPTDGRPYTGESFTWATLMSSGQSSELISEKLKVLLRHGFNAYLETGLEISPLNYAFQLGMNKCVKLFLEDKCPISEYFPGVLYGAASRGESECFRPFLDNLTDLSQWKDVICETFKLALQNGHSKSFSLLLEQYPGVGVIFASNLTEFEVSDTLSIPSELGHNTFLKSLIELRKDDILPYDAGRALLVASASGNTDGVQLLLKNFDEIPERFIDSALTIAIDRKYNDCKTLILNKRNERDDGCTLFKNVFGCLGLNN